MKPSTFTVTVSTSSSQCRAPVVPCTGTDDGQVNTAEFLEHALEDRRSIRLRHVEATHDRFGRECVTKGLESIEPAGQEP